MTEVRRHQRRTASGKMTTVRHHTRDAGGGVENHPPGTWYVRDGGTIYAVFPDGSTQPLPDEEERPPPPKAGSETPPAEPPHEGWWDDDAPQPEAWTDDDGPSELGLSDPGPPNPARDVPLGGDVPKPEAWTGNDDHVEHEGHVFKVNRAPAPRPQGDYDFRYDEEH